MSASTTPSGGNPAKREKKREAIVAVAVAVVILAAIIGGIMYTTSGNNDTKPTAGKPTATNSSTSATAETDGAASPSESATVKDGGKKEIVPFVDKAPDNPSADTTDDPLTPSTLPVGLCPTLENWKTLVNCVETNNLDWYIQGVNQRKDKTGFDWSDIKRWAGAKNADLAEVRVIQVFGPDISNKEARKRAAVLVGDDAANNMKIVRQPSCFVNTRGLEHGAMEDFAYCPPGSRQVRVSLLPAQMKKGKIVGIVNSDSGVFIDCDNLFWIPDVIIAPGYPPQKQPTPTPECKKKVCGTPPKEVCPWNPSLPPGSPNCLKPKDPRQGTQEQGNNRDGGGGKAPKQTDPVGPPKGGTPLPKYTPPAPPAPSSTPRPPEEVPTQKPSGPPATEHTPECPNADNPACG